MVGFGNIDGFVLRVVIHNNDFKIFVGLLRKGVKKKGKTVFFVTAGNNDGNKGGVVLCERKTL